VTLERVLGASLRRLAWLAAIVVTVLVGWAPAAQAQPSSRPTVVLFAVPGLRWADVTAMPHLIALASHSSVGELSVKTRGGITRCAAGLLAVSAGNRTAAPIAAIAPTGVIAPTAPTSRPVHCAVNMSTWPALRQANHTSRYDARIGSLGTTLQAAGIKTVAVTSVAVPMLANTSGQVDSVAPSIAKGMAIGGVVGIVDRRLYAVPSIGRPSAQLAVDATLATIEKLLPSGSILMVAGISDLSGGHAQLHAVVLSGPGWTHTQLRSSAAGRAPYVQLIDVAPTILAAEGLAVPSYMVGRPMQSSGSSAPGIASYIDDNHHAVAQRSLGQRVFLTLGIGAILMMLLAAAPVWAGRRLARWLARILAPAPALVFIANALPWWRWPQLAFAGIVLGGCLILATATTIAARRNVTAGLLVVPVFSFAALAIDQLTGATLQLSAPLGDSPLIAGRFSGMGNLDFAVMATSALIVAGVVGGRLSRLPAIICASAIAGVAVVVDGAPQLGNDIGGVLSLLPAGIVVVALVAQVRFTKRRVLGVVLTTLVVAVGVALVDYSRPATNQTDVGRFTGQVLHGGAGIEVRRKLDAALASFGWTIGTFVVVIAVLLAVIARTRIRRALATSPGAKAGVIASIVVAVLGVALNDSGITIAAMAVIVGVSAVYGAGLTGLPQPAEPT
jgi:hypothetical protein